MMIMIHHVSMHSTCGQALASCICSMEGSGAAGPTRYVVVVAAPPDLSLSWQTPVEKSSQVLSLSRQNTPGVFSDIYTYTYDRLRRRTQRRSRCSSLTVRKRVSFAMMPFRTKNE
jgi:hypothetical protein